jgi:hypothetical protein
MQLNLDHGWLDHHCGHLYEFGMRQYHFLLLLCFKFLPGVNVQSTAKVGTTFVALPSPARKLQKIIVYVIQHCFICRPSDSTMLEDAGSNPGCCDFGINSQTI